MESNELEYYKVRDSSHIKIIKEQADRIAKYEQVLHAIANDYHELSDHKIEVQNRNHKKWAREALDYEN